MKDQKSNKKTINTKLDEIALAHEQCENLIAGHLRSGEDSQLLVEDLNTLLRTYERKITELHKSLRNLTSKGKSEEKI